MSASVADRGTLSLKASCLLGFLIVNVTSGSAEPFAVFAISLGLPGARYVGALRPALGGVCTELLYTQLRVVQHTLTTREVRGDSTEEWYELGLPWNVQNHHGRVWLGLARMHRALMAGTTGHAVSVF